MFMPRLHGRVAEASDNCMLLQSVCFRAGTRGALGTNQRNNSAELHILSTSAHCHPGWDGKSLAKVCVQTSPFVVSPSCTSLPPMSCAPHVLMALTPYNTPSKAHPSSADTHATYLPLACRRCCSSNDLVAPTSVLHPRTYPSVRQVGDTCLGYPGATPLS